MNPKDCPDNPNPTEESMRWTKSIETTISGLLFSPKREEVIALGRTSVGEEPLSNQRTRLDRGEERFPDRDGGGALTLR